jgi:hypothetical protein
MIGTILDNLWPAGEQARTKGPEKLPLLWPKPGPWYSEFVVSNAAPKVAWPQNFVKMPVARPYNELSRHSKAQVYAPTHLNNRGNASDSAAADSD